MREHHPSRSERIFNFVLLASMMLTAVVLSNGKDNRGHQANSRPPHPPQRRSY